MKPLKEKISITIDNDILAKLKEKAEYDDRSLSQYINIVLKQHLKDKEDKKKPWISRLFYMSDNNVCGDTAILLNYSLLLITSKKPNANLVKN